MAKILTYKGKTEEELRSMSLAEFAELTTARIRRSLKRGLPESHKILLKRLETAKKPLKTHCRDLVIIPVMLGKQLLVDIHQASLTYRGQHLLEGDTSTLPYRPQFITTGGDSTGRDNQYLVTLPFQCGDLGDQV